MITAFPEGGQEPYSYSWSTGATTQTINDLPEGTYEVTVTDANGLTANASVFAAYVFMEVTLTSDVCELPYTATAEVVGGEGPYWFDWHTGDTTQTITVEPGEYCITLTDDNKCAIVECITIDPNPLLLDVKTRGGACPGAEDVEMNADVSGGTAPYTYLWSNGETTKIIRDLSPGTYTVTVTDDTGCMTVGSGTVAPLDPIVVDIDGIGPVCVDDDNGTITTSVTGGTPPYTYLWNTGATTASLSGLTPGTYTVTVTDANECVATMSRELLPQSDLVVNIDAEAQKCPEEPDGAATANPSGGMAPYGYLWSNGMTTQTITGLLPGTYSVTVTDDLGCQATATTEIDVAPDFEISVATEDVSSCIQDNGAAEVTVVSGVPPFSYEWSNGDMTARTENLSAGTYSVTVTNGNDCELIQFLTIGDPPAVVVDVAGTDLTCPDSDDGSASVTVSGGVAPYTYAWSSGEDTQDISGLSPGTYTVTVTDANDCTAVGSVDVGAPAGMMLETSGKNISCAGGNDGIVMVEIEGGTPDYQIRWSNGATQALQVGVPAGTYGVTVTDANGCTASTSIVLTEPDALVLSLEAEDVLCHGEPAGAVTTTVSGGSGDYTYAWSNNGTEANLTGVVAGEYTVTVTDENGCTATATATVEEPVPLETQVDIMPVNCNGASDGAATVTATGGTPPYTYLWSNDETTATITGVPAGTYGVTVTDANNCRTVNSVTIPEMDPLVVTLTPSDVLCAGEETGSVTTAVSGGMGDYTYAWSNNGTEANLTGVGAGVYSVTVTDANGCMATATATVEEPALLETQMSATPATCAGFSDGEAMVTAAGGTGPYTYFWDNNATTATITGLTAGTYSVTVTDANNCRAVNSVTVTEPESLVIGLTPSDVLCAGEETGGVTSSVSGGTGDYTYAWSNNGTDANLTGVGAGTYSVTVTDENGCTAAASVTVEEPALLETQMSATPATCAGFSDGEAMVTAAGGTTPYTYFWDNNATTATITGLTAGTYSVTVTDANGCRAVNSVTVTEPAPLVVSLTATDALCAGEETGGVNSSVSGGTGDYTYAWSNNGTDANLTGVGAGTYSVTVTDENGCTATAEAVVGEPVLLEVRASVTQDVCDGESNGAATAAAAGGTPNYTFSWSNGQMGPDLVDVPAGDYTVTVRDANGCEDSETITITAFENPACEATVISDVMDPNNPDGAAEATVSGGKEPYSYEWSSGQTTPRIGNLPAGDYTVTVTDDNGCTSICSVTIQAMAGLGDFVWEDIDRDGIQDANEPPIEGVVVKLKDADGQVIETDTTDANGNYAFIGLEAGNYSVVFMPPPGLEFTALNSGDNSAVDSDADPGMDGMTVTVTLGEGDFEPTIDAGFVVAPRSEFAGVCNCLNNATTEDDGQFLETVKIRSYPGETWTLISADNMFFADSPEPPAAPRPLADGTPVPEVADGEYQIDFRVIDDLFFTGLFSNGMDTIILRNICTYPTINANVPSGELCVIDEPVPLTANPDLPGTVVFTLDGEVITEIDPVALGVGEFELLVTFLPNDADECEATIVENIVITDGCLAMVGDFVWLDVDRDGIQDTGEPGIPGIEVIITSSDGAYADTTYTDVDGFYKFTVPLDEYKITFVNPGDLVGTPPDTGGDDDLDSDADPETGMTVFFVPGEDDPGISEMVMDFRWDAGFYAPCENITDPGEVGYDQMVCGPGIDPEPIVSIRDASGGEGEIEYLWMKSTQEGPFDPDIWTFIPNSNSPSYDPGPLEYTTYFARCARREGCITFLETNIVEIIVKNDAVAAISGPNYVCLGETATFNSLEHGAAADILWELEYLGNTVATATGPEFVYTFDVPGLYDVTLYVTENGCTSIRSQKFTASTNPTVCGSGFVIDAAAMGERQAVQVEWQMRRDFSGQRFTVEYARDGARFEPIGVVEEPASTENGMGYYTFIHEAPKKGWNYYRVVMESAWGQRAASDVADVAIFSDSKLLVAYPNPVQDELVVEILESFNETITFDLFNISGIRMEQVRIAGDTHRQTIDFSGYPAGAYFLRVRYGEADLKVVRVIKR